MKKLWWLLALVVLFSGLALAAEEEYTLTYREQPDPVRYRTEMDVKIVFHWPKEINLRPIEMRMVFRFDSTERWTPEGESMLRCSSTMNKVEVEAEFNDEKNSSEEDNLPSDKAIEIIMSPRGEVMEVLLPTPSEDEEEDETEEAASRFSPEQILLMNKIFYNLVYHYLPDHAVKRGDQWEVTYVFPKLSASGEEKLLPVTYELSKIRKSRGKRYATLVTSGQTVFDTVIDRYTFANTNEGETDEEADMEEAGEMLSEEEKEANLLSTLNEIAIIIPLQWKGKIVFGVDDCLLKERELELKGDGRIEMMSYVERIPMRLTVEARMKMKQL